MPTLTRGKESLQSILDMVVALLNNQAENGTTSISKVPEDRDGADGVKVRAAPSETWLSEIRSRRRKNLKLSNMGWWGSPKEKSMILVKLAQPIECGITMEGGKRTYERVNVSSDEGGE